MKHRFLYPKLEKHLKHKNHTIITGARQVGKTSLLKQLFQHLKDSNKAVYLVNLENKETLKSLNKNVKSIFNKINQTPKKIIDGRTQNRIYLLIDEIQYLDDPTNFLKYIYDEYEYNVKIIATGSSAFYIDKKFKDSLAGRKRIFHLYPLSFEEFLIFKEKKEIQTEVDYIVSEPSYHSEYGMNINNLLMEYLTFGGYPAVVLENDKEEKKWLLDELKNSYLRKDIIESGIEKETKFSILLQILADQTGNLVNKNEIGNTIGLDNKTAEKYVYILQKCFHIDLVKPFFRNIRKELTKMPKIYFNDIGLRNAILGRLDYPQNRADKGEIFENFVYNQLRIKHNQESIKFWRTTNKNEVDFVIEERFNEGYALEVKWDCNKFISSKYKKFTTMYPNFPLQCIDHKNIEILNR